MGRLFVVGDVHGGQFNRETNKADNEKISKKTWKEQENLTKEDVLIQLGDFGYIWFHELHPDRKKDDRALKELSERNFTLAFVDGNHENFDLIEKTPIIEKWGGLVNEVYPNIYRLRRGEIYNINGKTIFVFGGAMSNPNQKKENFSGKGIYKKEKKQKSWWEQEIPTIEEMEYGLDNLNKFGLEVDYILTHTCASETIKSIFHKTGQADFNRLQDPVSLYLDKIKDSISFKEWHFGHHHQDVFIEENNEKFFCHYNNIPKELV